MERLTGDGDGSRHLIGLEDKAGARGLRRQVLRKDNSFVPAIKTDGRQANCEFVKNSGLTGVMVMAY